jgi:hypothetical protein
MKRQRARIRKARKEPTKERKLANPPQVVVPWGRGASEYRPGFFIKRYLQEHAEAPAADIFYALSEELVRLNTERLQIEERPLRRPNYSSFARYFHWFKLLGLVEPIHRREPAIYDFLQARQFYRLTAQGKAEIEAWRDPVAKAHPEFR